MPRLRRPRRKSKRIKAPAASIETAKVVKLPEAKALEAAAAGWVAREFSGVMTEDDRMAFDTWLRESPRHADAHSRIYTLWADFGEMAGMTSSRTPAMEPLELESSDDDGGLGWRGYASWAQRGIAATVVLCTFGISMGVWQYSRGQHAAYAPLRNAVSTTAIAGSTRFSTAKGETRNVALADGSQIVMNTGTQLTVAFGARHREIRLVEGEAFFTVAPDRTRPFRVATANGDVEAVGTAFAVRLRSASVEVTVREGKVAIVERRSTPAASVTSVPPTSPLQSSLPIAMISAGEKAVIEQTEAIVSAVPIVKLDQQLAWRAGYAVFSGETLPEAIAEIGRYSDLKVEIVDPELNELRIRGRFRTGNVASLLDALEAGFGVQVERVSERHVRLSAG